MSGKMNFLAQFREGQSKTGKKFTAAQFAEVWNTFDADGNGYIEGKELDNFLREFIIKVLGSTDSIGESALATLRKDFMAEFDSNKDDKIDISELAQILPTDENFLLLFRRTNPLDSSVDFMKIWKRFDKDKSGYIESSELIEFLREMLNEKGNAAKLSEDKLAEYTNTLLSIFDKNKDGKLQLSEMSKLLPVKENHLANPIFNNADKISEADIDRIFAIYDQDNNGTIEDEELQGFLKDLLDRAQESYDDKDLDYFRNIILKEWDVDHDGKISKPELKMILLQQSKIATALTDRKK